MTRRLRLPTVVFGLVVLLILVMPSQVGFVVSVKGFTLPLTVADVVLALAFVGAVLNVLARKGRRLVLPPLPALALVAVAAVAVLRTADRAGAVREVAQLVEYLLVAYFVFANVPEMGDLQPLVAAFAVAVAAVVGWAGVQYLTCESALDVRAGFIAANHNLLGAFLAVALSFLYGIALHARTWRVRLALLALVALGLCVILSGGPLVVTLVVLGVLSAVRGERALVPYLIVLGLALDVAPRLLPRPHHTDTLVNSVAVTVDDNFLLSDRQLVERAGELLEPTKPIRRDKTSDETVIPAPRPLDAGRLLRLLNDRRRLTPDEQELQVRIQRTIAALSEGERAAYPLDRPQVARRYQEWQAALLAARTLWLPDVRRRPNPRADLLLGCGLDPYHESIKGAMSQRLQYRTDEPEVFNIAAPEPFTHNLWLKTFIQTGLLGLLALAWLLGSFLGRAARLYRAAHGEVALGVSLGALGAILGFALAGLFTETIVRGLAIPFVFILATLPIAERIVHGGRRPALEKLSARDS